MNTIYRIVWNAATGKWVVASELAKGRTKKSSRKLLSALLAIATIGGLSFAHDSSATVVLGTGAVQGASSNTVIGDGAKGAAACGLSSYLPGTACSTVVGMNASTSAYGSVALGDNASVTAILGTAVGSYATAGQFSQAFGAGANASGSWATAIGQSAQATFANTTAVGNNATTGGSNATALGSGAHANQANSFALGWSANANTAGAMAFGTSVTSTGVNAIAMGMGSNTNADYSVAIGSAAKVIGKYGIAMGSNATADQAYSAIAGDGAVAIGTNAYAGGGALTNANLNGSVALGANTSSYAAGSVAIGDGAKASVSPTTGVAGTDANFGVSIGMSSVSANAGSAIGYLSNASGNKSTAIGVRANAAASDAVAMGDSASVNSAATSGLALGSSSSVAAAATNSVALGAGSAATAANTVSLGTSSSTRRVVNMTAGVAATDAVNVSQLAPIIAGLGGGAAINPTTGAVTGPTYTFANGSTYNNVGGALNNLDGRVTTLEGASNPYISFYGSSAGSASTTAGPNTMAIGSGASAGGNGATALGGSSKASANGAAALGNSAQATAVNASAFGFQATAAGSNSTAFGTNSSAAAQNAVTLGNTTSVASTSIGGVALGSNAAVAANATSSMALGASSSVASGITNSMALGASSQATAANTVSVGSSTLQRRVVNMAAGVQSTDAVNVSQLQPVVAGLGGGATINTTTGAVTGPTYNVQGGTQTNVGSALDALNTGVNNAVVYDSPMHNSVKLGGAAATAPVALRNVANGTLSSTSTDAVNGAQLNATNLNVATNTTNIANLGDQVTTNTGDISNLTKNISNGTVGLVQQAAAGSNLTVGKDTDGAKVDFSDKSGNTRTLSSVKAGVSDTDAVNMSQLNTTNSNVTNLGNRVTTVEGDVTTIKGTLADAVVYDDSSHSSATLGGTAATAPVALHNVAGGELSATSNDAVNGSQLYATNQNVATNTTNIANLGDQVATNTSDITNLQNNIGNGTVGLVQQAGAGAALTVGKDTDGSAVDFADKSGNTRTLSNVTAGSADTDAVNVSQLKSAGLIDGNGNAIAAVTYDPNTDGTPNYASVTLGGTSATAPVALHNVASGELSATSTDAVNGSQLNTTNTNVTNLGNRVTTVEGDVTTIKGTLADAVSYDDSSHSGVTLGGTSATTPVALHNVASGELSAASTDAVNGSQLYATNQNVSQNSTDITNLQNNIGNGTVGLVQQAGAGAALTVGKDTDGSAIDFADKSGNTRTLSNVTAGSADTDAVNVSQLKSAGLIDGNGNAIAAVTYDQNTDGTPNYNSVTMGGGKSAGAVTIHNVAAGSEDTDAVNVGQLNSSLAGSGLVDSNGNALDAVVYDPGSNRGQVTLGGVGASAPVVLTNVADGKSTYDAVNYGQLSGLQSNLQNQINNVNGQVTNIDNRVSTLENDGGSSSGAPFVAAHASSRPAASADVGDSTGVALGYNTAATGEGASAVGDSAQATGDNSIALGNNAVASSTNGMALGGGSSVNANNAVAVGSTATVAATASNGTAVGSGSNVAAASGTAVGQGASVASGATNAVALGAGSVATQANSVSVGSAGAERTVTNVAAGVNATDAVNVSQLQSSQDWAKNYSDQQTATLNNRITHIGQHADAGTAAAMAMTNIPQAYQPNQSSVGAGVGTFNGQAAVAVGMSTITPSGRWVLKGSLTGNSQGDVGVGFGASMVW